jgi:cell division protein FtsQ
VARFQVSIQRPTVIKWSIIGAIVAVLLGAGWFLLRDSSLVGVTEVEIHGLHSSQTPMVRSALESEAKEMTTLHVRTDALKQAVAKYSSVADLKVESHFPHKLTINVVERVPVAIYASKSGRFPVNADGLLLRGLSVRGRLPAIRSKAIVTGDRVTHAGDKALLQMLGAAPKPLRERVKRAEFEKRGIAVDMHSGPRLIFGGPTKLKAKWDAVIRVLADPGSAGATYIDVRLPERVGVGGTDKPSEAASGVAPSTNTAPAEGGTGTQTESSQAGAGGAGSGNSAGSQGGQSGLSGGGGANTYSAPQSSTQSQNPSYQPNPGG